MKYLDYVNIRHGTASQPRFSNGNTLPLTALPHSMTAFAPQTSCERGNWFYHPEDRSIEGIRLTHQPSPWIGDFSHFCFMPQRDGVFVNEHLRWSGFKPEDAELHPHYLKINFLRYKATLTLAPVDSGAAIELEYEGDAAPQFAVLPGAFKGEIFIDNEKGEIRGYTTSKTMSPKRGDLRIYFIFRFDCSFDPQNTVLHSTDGSFHKQQYLSADGAGCNVTLLQKKATAYLTTSYVGYKQAELNLERELNGKSVSDICKAAENIWENTLSLIEAEGEPEQLKTFYSCMYRAFLYPTKFYETDQDGKPFHVIPETGVIKPGIMYVNNGFWDTYRTVYPLYSVLCPKKYAEIVEGYLNFFDDTGYLPRWIAPGELGVMPGTLIEAVLADAVVKGIVNESTSKRILQAVIKNATIQSANSDQGRKAVDDYKKLGYIPKESTVESVNETLDCAFGDFCIARIAEKTGNEKIMYEYDLRSKNYKNIFDPVSGFMRAKDINGQMSANFDPYEWGGDYTEASAWQSSFAVQHDPEGLACLFGGKEKLIEKLDSFFAAPPDYRIGGYKKEIHEMTEMAAVNFGQCAISNQPSFHIPYLYSALGDRKKTEYWVEKLVKEAFSSGAAGFPGDEDNGTTASWYIFACIGFYPLCPGKAEYITSKPLLENIKIKGKPIGRFAENLIKHKELFSLTSL